MELPKLLPDNLMPETEPNPTSSNSPTKESPSSQSDQLSNLPKKGRHSAARGRWASRLPPDHQSRWPTLLEHVESGKTWVEAYKLTYPEFKNKAEITTRVGNLRRASSAFRNFLRKRGSKSGENTKFPKAELEDHLLQIARFNLADLYEIGPDGELKLRENWLAMAKKMNVINKITLKKRVTTDARTGDETSVEIMEVTPYSRFAALCRLSKVFGYESSDKTPGQIQTVTTNNIMLVKQIESIRKASKEGNVPGMPIEVNEDFVEKMVKATITDKPSQVINEANEFPE